MIVSVTQAQLFFLVFTRVIAILVQIPLFGGTMVPNQVKIAISFILSLIIVPWQPLPPDSTSLTLWGFTFAVFQEIIIGGLAGFAGTLTFAAFQVAGKLMDLSSGFGAGQIFNPALGDTGSSLEQTYTMTALLLFLITNGHHKFIFGLKRTFDIIPSHGAFPAFAAERLLNSASGLIAAGIQMSLPVMAALVLTDLALGLLAKVSPQINVFFLGLPIKVWLGVMGLSLAFPYLMPFFRGLFEQIGIRVIYLLGA